MNEYIHTYIHKERKNAAAQFKKDMCTPMFITALFTIAKASVHQKMYSGILFSHNKKKQMLPFTATWTELEGIILSEISHAENEKHQMISLTCEVSEKRERVKEQDSSRLTEPKKGLMVTKGNVTEEDGFEGREERENGALQVEHIMWAGGWLGEGSVTAKISSASTAYSWADG